MELQFSKAVAHPPLLVYTAMRDRLPELAAYLEGVESIEVVERRQLGPGRLYLLNLWQAEPAAVPRAARPFVSRRLLRWKDHAEWNDAERLVRWRFEALAGGDLFRCQGSNRFCAGPDGHTVMEIGGHLELFLERVPGLPRRLARGLGPRVERFIGAIVGANLAGLARGLQRFLDARG